jgi:uncharacterized membrane protein
LLFFLFFFFLIFILIEEIIERYKKKEKEKEKEEKFKNRKRDMIQLSKNCLFIIIFSIIKIILCFYYILSKKEYQGGN